MGELGLIEWKRDLIDLRIRRYHLSNKARFILDQNLRKLYLHDSDGIANTENGGLFGFIERLREILKIKIFSDEYKIILIMYENGNIHTTDLLKISALSASSFYKSLAQVIDAGLVTHFPDPDDSRKTINHIKDEVRIFLDQIHLELSDWAASI